jgi:hypothetical protein
MKTTEILNPDNQFELSNDIPSTKEVKFYTNEQLVVPALLPYISDAVNSRPIFKRNEKVPEMDTAKINQKKIEMSFESSIFLVLPIFLTQWSDLVRNPDQTLTCSEDEVLGGIFTQLADFGNSINAEFDIDPIVGKILVPELKKPQSLLNALRAEAINRNRLEYVYRYLLSSTK